MANQMSGAAARSRYMSTRRRTLRNESKRQQVALGSRNPIDGRRALLELCGHNMDRVLRAKLEAELAADAESMTAGAPDLPDVCQSCEFAPWCDCTPWEAEDCALGALDANYLEDRAYARELAENRATLGAK